MKYSHVRTHVTALWKTLDKTVYQDEAGEFYKVTYDFATYTPMMEHACGRVYYIGNFFYLYNGMTGLNDGWVNYGGQIDVVYKVRAKPKLECLTEYKALTMYDDTNLVYWMIIYKLTVTRIFNRIETYRRKWHFSKKF